LPERPGLAHKDQEGNLERLFGIVRVAEDATANAEDHGAVPANQDRERVVIVATDELFDQVGVTRVLGRGSQRSPANRTAQQCHGHRSVPSPTRRELLPEAGGRNEEK
jgi:hypothetical protein